MDWTGLCCFEMIRKPPTALENLHLHIPLLFSPLSALTLISGSELDRPALRPGLATDQSCLPVSAGEFWFSDGSLADKSKFSDPGLMPLPDTASGLDWSHLVDAARAFEGNQPG